MTLQKLYSCGMAGISGNAAGVPLANGQQSTLASFPPDSPSAKETLLACAPF